MPNDRWDDFAIDEGIIPRLKQVEHVTSAVAPLPDAMARLQREAERSEERLSKAIADVLAECRAGRAEQRSDLLELKHVLNTTDEGQRTRTTQKYLGYLAGAIVFVTLIINTLVNLLDKAP